MGNSFSLFPIPYSLIMKNKITAIVLAGGQSSRMGRDKALIEINGVALLQFVCQVAAECADTVYVVTSWPERYQHLLLPNCEFILDCENQGPLVGFALALKQVKTEWVLLLACDMPKLKGEVLRDWGSQLDKIDKKAIASVKHPVYAYLAKGEKGWEPLCGFYRRSCYEELLKYIASGGRSFQGWLSECNVASWNIEDKEMFFDCDTPEDINAYFFL